MKSLTAGRLSAAATTGRPPNPENGKETDARLASWASHAWQKIGRHDAGRELTWQSLFQAEGGRERER